VRLVRPLGLRARLAIALVGVAVLAVGVATLLSNRGLSPRLSDAAQDRLERSAEGVAKVAGRFYLQDGGWTQSRAVELEHLSMVNGLAVTVLAPDGRPVLRSHEAVSVAASEEPRTASAPVVVAGRKVGSVVVTPLGSLLTPEEEHLQHSVDRLHLAAGAISAAAALAVAFVLAYTLSGPLRRIRLAAQRIERGDLSARIELGGDAEVQAVGHALNRLAETLEHEEEIRKQTVADLAHELRTPVTGMLSRIEAAQDGVLSDEAANLEAMHSEALRLARLLDDLAKLAEAERPGLLLEKRPLDLAEVVRGQAEEFTPRFAEKGVAFTTEFEPVGIAGDSDRLSQVASNLLSNALRYTEPGGEVSLRVGTEGASAVLEVTDTGIGIAPEDLKHIFKRFWRGEKSRSRATGGAGIGLAIVHELVRAHEGRIDVESTLGRGSRFSVQLPALPIGALQANGGRPPRDFPIAASD
jgi:signal transduction histidine kinase